MKTTNPIVLCCAWWAGSLALLAGCGSVASSASEATETRSDALAVDAAQVWPWKAIKVCWRPSLAEGGANSRDPSPQDESTHPGRRAVVRAAVANSWERVSRVKFVGWGLCSTQDENSPNVLAVVSGKPPGGGLFQIGYGGLPWGGIDLNRFDLEGVAMHEFGHALSFLHEHNRVDAPDTDSPCSAGEWRSGQGADNVGAYDHDSIMNFTYCNGIGALTQTDILGVRKYYGSRGPLRVAMRSANDELFVKSYEGGWTNWTSFGTGAASEPTIVIDSNNQVSFFVRKYDNHVWTRVFYPANNTWSDWFDLGGNSNSAPSAIQTEDSRRLVVFARASDNTIQHSYYSGGWQPWAKITSSTRTFTSAPAAAVTNERRTVVFARGTDNDIWHTWYDQATSQWVEWVLVPGGSGLNFTSAPAATVTAEGRVVVFAMRSDNSVWHNYYDPGAQSWANWTSLGGSFSPGSTPAAAVSPEGRLVVYGRWSDNKLYHAFYDNGWSNWISLSESQPGTTLTSGPGAMN
jgi:hypothetical protein